MKLSQLTAAVCCMIAVSYSHGLDNASEQEGLVEDGAVVSDERPGGYLARSLKTRAQLRNMCQQIANGDHATSFSSCANDLFFAGHKAPSDSGVSAAAVCSTLSETDCRQTFGCMFYNDICIDTTNNAFCGAFPNKALCQGRGNQNNNKNACYWKGGECLLRFQDCSLLGPVECVRRDGCMWFNDLVNGHQQGFPGTSSVARGRCMADPCFRINNGRCTIQHTGGRCLWYTKQQNKAVRGLNYPGCYTSPCNNRFKRSDCKGDAAYDCHWCGKTNGLLLGCQNYELTSKAQCWNVNAADRGTPVPAKESNKCKRCLQGRAYEDGKCHFRNRRTRERCQEYCCQGPYCHCFFNSAAAGANSNSGLSLFTGDGDS